MILLPRRLGPRRRIRRRRWPGATRWTLWSKALGELPRRQREAFMLRNFEGTGRCGQTAAAMGCSDGSVKTHYSRAVHRLREMLGDHI